ncbi:MAG: type III pantothenate kinase [Flavobacteriales bacterium]|nr:type III pantothenate kinase [Flavobacteriales bacterium]
MEKQDLVLDVGNTRVKWAVFNGGEVVANGSFQRGEEKELAGMLATFTVGAIALGATAAVDGMLLDTLRSSAPVLEMTGASDAPIRTRYGTRPTLGADRLANAVAAVKRFPGRASLCIDLGTCVTYDLCEADGTYAGGAISPGFRMRGKAMNAYSARLPLVEPELRPALIGTTTQQSLASGVHYGLLGEVESFIRRYQHGRPGLAVLLTGGDAPRIAGGLESGIFALPLHTLEGYHALLQHHRSLTGGPLSAGIGGGVGPGATG